MRIYSFVCLSMLLTSCSSSPKMCDTVIKNGKCLDYRDLSYSELQEIQNRETIKDNE